jgi:hypothetical protein
MSDFRITLGRVGATAAVVASGLAFVSAAHADEPYKADRAYCVSGEASEARNLCLKEAAAAQADRQRGSHGTTNRAHRKSKSKSAASPEKSASSP